MKPSQVRVGMKFSCLTVTCLYHEERPCPSSSTGFQTYQMSDVRCSCGRVKTGVRVCHLASGATESCGSCGLKEERTIEALTTHGLSDNPLFKTAHNINERCKNPDSSHWKDYGGRGISIEYPPWDRDANPGGFVQSFVEWNASLPKRKQWRPGLWIERINNDRGYHPNNCRWESQKVQYRNKQDTIRRMFRGSETPLIDIYDIGIEEGWVLGEINYRCFKARLRLGWTLQQACKIPIGARR